MLNIPEEVEEALKEGASKNFRVHFPNGERADITNDNIVSESVNFTESICSQSELKFGLAEASVLEFETVGVENIRGAEIEASIEVTFPSSENLVVQPFIFGTSYSDDGVYFLANDDNSIYIGRNASATKWTATCSVKLLNLDSSCRYMLSGCPDNANIRLIGTCDGERFVDRGSGVIISNKSSVNITIEVDRYFAYHESATIRPTLINLDEEETYSIPYGKFIVDECPRQTNLEHRKITAYSTSALNNDTWNEIELFRRSCVTKSSDDYLYDAVTNSVFQFVPTERVDGFTYVRINNPGTITVYLGQVILRLPDRIIDATMQLICHYVYGETANHAEFPDLKYTLEELRQQMRDVGFSEKDISRIITDDLGKAIYGECVMEFGVPKLSTTKDRFVYTSRKNIGSCDVGTFQDSTKFLAYIVPWRLQFGPSGEEFKVDLRDWVDFYDVDTPNNFSSYVHLKKTKIGTNKYVCNVQEEHAPSEYLKSYLESNFLFGNYARNNQFRLVSLGDKFADTHYQMQKSDYSQIWYDERPTLPYGIFRFGYTDSNDDEQLFEHRVKKGYFTGTLVDEEDVTASTNYVNLTINTSAEQRTSAEELIISVPGIITEIYFYGFDTYMYENRDLPSGQSELIVKASDFVNVYGDAFTDFSEAVTVDIYYTPNDSGTVSVNEVNWQYYSESDSLTYDFTGNLILQKDGFWLENHFNSLEDSVKGIVFYPADISSVGLPFIEAGDVIDIETDGGTITTFAEKRTISGVQALFDDISAEASSDTYINGSDYSTGSSGGGTPSPVVVNDSTITIEQGNFSDSFTLNQSSNKTISLPEADTSNCYKTTDATSTSLADADYVPISKSTGKVKATFTTIKSFLKTYFDALYSKVTANPPVTTSNTLSRISIDGTVYNISGGGGGGGGGLDLLWTNSSPGSSFTAKTLSLAVSTYAFLLIEIRFTTTTDNYATVIVRTNGHSFIEAFLASANRYRRSITASGSSVTFGSGEKASPSATTYSTDNTCYIPVAIYGMK